MNVNKGGWKGSLLYSREPTNKTPQIMELENHQVLMESVCNFKVYLHRLLITKGK